MDRKKKIFRFEEMWLSDKGCAETVEVVWLSHDFNHSNFRVMDKIEKCGVELLKWSQEHFGSVKIELMLKRKMLAKAEKEAMMSRCNNWVRELKLEIDTLMDKENRIWLQHSKTLWATKGDRNTRYLHFRATKWYRKNYINRLWKPDGQWSSSKEEAANILVKYYTELYTLAAPIYFEETLHSIHTLVSAQMNEKLLVEFKSWEVHAAVKQMAPFKALGPDGMPPVFFQDFWPLIGAKVTNFVLHLLNIATFPSHLNHTFISLIPGVQNLELVSEFRPISLCKVLYKIFPKVLANRLKKILHALIIEHQSAFTKSHLISNNILVAFESLHSMQNHRSSKEGYMAIKLDMSKTYDRVEWSFLEVVMRRIGFTKRWIQLMMVGVTLVSYSILVNGEPKGLIKPS